LQGHQHLQGFGLGYRRLRPGAPILRSVALNHCPEGRPVEYGTTWFAGDRVALTLAPDAAPDPTADPAPPA
jgi:hypothetical protein